jgi:hypothetical protein
VGVFILRLLLVDGAKYGTIINSSLIFEINVSIKYQMEEELV